MCRDLTLEGKNLMKMSLQGTTRDDEQLLAVLTALKNGDFTQRMPEGSTGAAGQIAETLNAIMEQCGAFTAETDRITREIGVEGRLGGQAQVFNLSGSWQKSLDNLNVMARNVTAQVRDFAITTTAVANGDLTRKVTVAADGEILEWKTTVNIMIDQLNAFASELTHVVRDLGTEGKFGAQMEIRGAAGTWKDLIANVNQMVRDLTRQIRSLSQVTYAVAGGDLSMRITAEARGETQALLSMVNGMTDRLNVLVAEFERITREIGTEGKFGGQAEVEGVRGQWKDLIDGMNRMSANLTTQVRDVSRSVHALAAGDASRKVTVTAAGETVELKEAVNRLIDQYHGSPQPQA